ncbi:hypothetical protein [Chitinophaga pinensis]|nr:hypothetical protein [Chitinophaga pinensis]
MTIIAGLGLLVLGGAVVFFMVKFVFTVSKDEKEARVETNETNTRFPKKIYLSQDVNACVFYHSSFWSMFPAYSEEP